jgi:hypothetical protein
MTRYVTTNGIRPLNIRNVPGFDTSQAFEQRTQRATVERQDTMHFSPAA